MLEKIDMSKKIKKGEYSDRFYELGLKLGEVQRRARDAKLPIIIVFEGWRGAKRSEIINAMMQKMDARGFDVLSTMEIVDNTTRPAFEYFWKNLPGLGEIRVYHRSWYYMGNVHLAK